MTAASFAGNSPPYFFPRRIDSLGKSDEPRAQAKVAESMGSGEPSGPAWRRAVGWARVGDGEPPSCVLLKDRVALRPDPKTESEQNLNGREHDPDGPPAFPFDRCNPFHSPLDSAG